MKRFPEDNSGGLCIWGEGQEKINKEPYPALQQETSEQIMGFALILARMHDPSLKGKDY